MWRPRDRERFIGSYDPEHEMPDPDRDAGDRWQSDAYRRGARDSRFAYRFNPDMVERGYNGPRRDVSREADMRWQGDARDMGYYNDRDRAGYGGGYGQDRGGYGQDRGNYGGDRGNYGYDRGYGGYNSGGGYGGGGGYSSSGRFGADRGWDRDRDRWGGDDRNFDRGWNRDFDRDREFDRGGFMTGPQFDRDNAWGSDRGWDNDRGDRGWDNDRGDRGWDRGGYEDWRRDWRRR